MTSAALFFPIFSEFERIAFQYELPQRQLYLMLLGEASAMRGSSTPIENLVSTVQKHRAVKATILQVPPHKDASTGRLSG